MIHVFRACRDIGQAFILVGLTQKDGSANCRSAANELRLTNEPIYKSESNQLDNIASNWRGLSSQVGPTFNRIQSSSQNFPGDYHAASAGFLMGMAIAGCSNVGKESDFSFVQSKILEYLQDAKAHIRAIKDEGFKKDMRVFDQDFNSLISGISSIGKTTADCSQEYHRAVQLVRGLSDQVANALR
jgi:hypothetical protein